MILCVCAVVQVEVRCTAEDELPLIHSLSSKAKIRYSGCNRCSARWLHGHVC